MQARTKKVLATGLVLLIVAFISYVLTGRAQADDHNDKVEICHVPPGNPENAHTIEISENALETHLAHGDTLGACLVEAPEEPETPVEPVEPVVDECLDPVTGEDLCIEDPEVPIEVVDPQPETPVETPGPVVGPAPIIETPDEPGETVVYQAFDGEGNLVEQRVEKPIAAEIRQEGL